MRVGLTEDEAADLLAMSGPELVDYLTDAGLPVPERLRRLGPGQSPAETLSRDDVATIVAPLASPPGEPAVRGIATDVDRHDALLNALGRRFAGRAGLARLADDGTIVIPVANMTPADQQAGAAMGRNAGTTVTVEALEGLTADELGALRGDVEAALQASGLPNWGVGILGDTQSLYVSVPEAQGTEVRAKIAELASDAAGRASQARSTGVVHASDAVIVVDGVNTGTEARDKAPQGGGKWINVGSGLAGCTMGYVVQNSNGQNRGLSAGHCAGVGVTGVTVKDRNLNGSTDNQLYGSVILNTYANNAVDAMTWPIADWDGHTRVWLGDGWKILQGMKPESQQTLGLQVCGTGWGIQNVDGVNQKCDSLDILNYAFTDNGITTPDTNCFERHTRGGDSGGPTYALDSEGRALAAGITKGDHHTSFLGVTSHYWCYVTIDGALSIAGYTLPTGK